MADIRWGPFTDHEKALALDVLRHLGGSPHWRLEWQELDETVIEDFRFGSRGSCYRSAQIVVVDDTGMTPTEQIWQVFLHEAGHAYHFRLVGLVHEEPGAKLNDYLSGITSAVEARQKVKKDYADLPTWDRVYEEMTPDEFREFAGTVNGSTFSVEQWAEYFQILWRWYSCQVAPGDRPSIGARLETLLSYPVEARKETE